MLWLRERVLSDLAGEEGGEEVGEEVGELVLPVLFGGVSWSVLDAFCPSLPPDRSEPLLSLFLSLTLWPFGEGDFLLMMSGMCAERLVL